MHPLDVIISTGGKLVLKGGGTCFKSDSVASGETAARAQLDGKLSCRHPFVINRDTLWLIYTDGQFGLEQKEWGSIAVNLKH